MTNTFKLERLDGTPADPPSFETARLLGLQALALDREVQVAFVGDVLLVDAGPSAHCLG